jgi:hypothetical protein
MLRLGRDELPHLLFFTSELIRQYVIALKYYTYRATFVGM